MQCNSERESRYLHDQLAVLGPLLQALSAATPIFRGRLAATDTRWDAISMAVDDRNPVEEGLLQSAEAEAAWAQPESAGSGVRRLSRSRYSSVGMLIGQPEDAAEQARIDSLNDVPVDFDETAMQELTAAGMDAVLARHVAHLFTRDPLVIFDDAIALDDERALDHFENIQSTNWRSMRWKLPSLGMGLEYEARRKSKSACAGAGEGEGSESESTSAKESEKTKSTEGAAGFVDRGAPGDPARDDGTDWAVRAGMELVDGLTSNLLMTDKVGRGEGAVVVQLK
jgi:hypothetical protein